MGTSEKDYFILYVDDEEKTLKYFDRYFSQNYAILTAQNPSDARTILEQKADQIAVLITDQRMPKEKGVELLSYAREHYPKIIRLLTTAYSDLDDAINAVNNGEISRYITKPWDINLLEYELRHALDCYRIDFEKERLRAEKINIIQRLTNVNRARDLIVLSNGFTHLRHSLHAVNAFLCQLSSLSATQGTTDLQRLDMWELVKDELSSIFSLTKDILKNTQHDNNDEFADISIASTLQTSYERLGLSGRIILPKDCGEIQAHHGLIDTLFTMLIKQITGLNRSDDVSISAEMTADGVNLETSLSDIDLKQLTMLGLSSEILIAYLICYHHSGNLEIHYDEKSIDLKFKIFLPKNPGQIKLPELADDWLDNVFNQYEFWPE